MGKVFEFYRRAAAGNGDTGTPVPRPHFRMGDRQYWNDNNTLTAVVTVINDGTADGSFNVFFAGSRTITGGDRDGDVYNLVFNNPRQTFLKSGERATVYGTASLNAVAGERGAVEIEMTLSAPGQPDQKASQEGTWQFIGIGT